MGDSGNALCILGGIVRRVEVHFEFSRSIALVLQLVDRPRTVYRVDQAMTITYLHEAPRALSSGRRLAHLSTMGRPEKYQHKRHRTFVGRPRQVH